MGDGGRWKRDEGRGTSHQPSRYDYFPLWLFPVKATFRYGYFPLGLLPVTSNFYSRYDCALIEALGFNPALSKLSIMTSTSSSTVNVDCPACTRH